MGVPVLQWLGMARGKDEPGTENTFPCMIKWLRDADDPSIESA